MPRVERTIDTSAEHSGIVAFYSLDCGHENLKVPIGTNNARLIVEWDDPPVDDWTPAKAALYMWNCLNMTREEIANKIAELERAKCAEIAGTFRLPGVSDPALVELCLQIRDYLLARTNDEAGYPRME